MKRCIAFIGVIVNENKQKGNSHSVVRSDGSYEQERQWYVEVNFISTQHQRPTFYAN
jgi:hypothetical protein